MKKQTFGPLIAAMTFSLTGYFVTPLTQGSDDTVPSPEQSSAIYHKMDNPHRVQESFDSKIQ